MKVVIRWKRGFDNQVQPILKQLEQFRTILANDLPRGVQFLDQAVRTLETYAGIARQGGIATDALRTERENEEDGAL